MLCDDLEGWGGVGWGVRGEAKEGGDICTHVADSHRRTAETNTTLAWRCTVVSDSSQPHGLRPARLLCPRDSPGRDTGVGCHFLLQGIFLTERWSPCFLGFLTTVPPGKPVPLDCVLKTEVSGPIFCYVLFTAINKKKNQYLPAVCIACFYSLFFPFFIVIGA